MISNAELERQLEASICRDSFWHFVLAVWAIVEPTRALLPSVAINALCAMLQEAAERGGRWVASMPPGVSKSLVAAVLWPAWLLLRSNGAARIMAGSYAWDLASRDSARCKALIESPWYRRLVGNAWSIRTDADRRDDFWTTTSGRRLITSTGAKSTGERATTQVLDDVLSAADVFSAAKRKEAAHWLTQVLPSRLEDPEHDCRVLIGQRLHPGDPLGTALEQGGWQYLKLPALATDDPCELRRADGSLIWRDPRAPGEPLVSLLSPVALDRLKLELGSAAFLSQYMQEPSSDELSTIRRSWLKFYKLPHAAAGGRRPAGCDVSPAAELPTAFDKVVIAADLSFGSLKGDYCSVQAWGAKGGARYLLEEWHKRAGFEEQVAAIRSMSDRYPMAKVSVEKAANGAAVIETLSKAIPGVVPVTPQGPKEARVASVLPQLESGSVYLPEGVPWIDDYVEELAGFGTHAKFDDRPDAMAYALISLRTSSAVERCLMLGRWDSAPKPTPPPTPPPTFEAWLAATMR